MEPHGWCAQDGGRRHRHPGVSAIATEAHIHIRADADRRAWRSDSQCCGQQRCLLDGIGASHLEPTDSASASPPAWDAEANLRHGRTGMGRHREASHSNPHSYCVTTTITLSWPPATISTSTGTLDSRNPGGRPDRRDAALCATRKGLWKGLWPEISHVRAIHVNAKLVAPQQVSRVGRRGLEPRTYGLKAHPLAPCMKREVSICNVFRLTEAHASALKRTGKGPNRSLTIGPGPGQVRIDGRRTDTPWSLGRMPSHELSRASALKSSGTTASKRASSRMWSGIGPSAGRFTWAADT